MAVQELGRVFKAEISPVIAEDGIRDICRTVFHGGIGFIVTLNQVKILIHGLDFRIVRPFQDTGLNPERFIAVYGAHVLFPDVSELGNPVNLAVILADLIPFRIGVEILDVGIFIQVIIQGNQGACLIQLNLSVAAVYEVRVFTAGNHGPHSFLCGLACQPGFFDFSACDFGNFSLYFVVIVDFRTRNCKKCGKFLYGSVVCRCGRAFCPGSGACGRSAGIRAVPAACQKGNGHGGS